MTMGRSVFFFIVFLTGIFEICRYKNTGNNRSIVRKQQIMKETMKKAWLFSLVFIICGTAYSQRKYRLAFSASPSMNWMSSDTHDVDQGKVSMGIDYGLNADFYFDELGKYAFATGLLINHSGGNLAYYNPGDGDIEFAGETFPSGTSFHYGLRYIEVPLAVKLKTSNFRRWSYWGQFGFSTFINIQAKGESSSGSLQKTGINEEIKLYNMALNIGVGSYFDLGQNNALSIGIIFKNGFIDITSNEQFEDETTLNSLVLNLGLVF